VSELPTEAPPRWQNYVLERDSNLRDAWVAHLSEPSRQILFVMGRGFDPRTCLGLRMMLEAGGDGKRDILALELLEGDSSPSHAHAGFTQQNWEEIQAAAQGRGNVESRALPFWSAEGRRVGSQNAAHLFTNPEQLRPYSDVVVDVSAMPRSIFFPLIARLLYWLDEWPGDGSAPNLHVLVAEDPDLDSRIQVEGIDETGEFLSSFEGGFNQEAKAAFPKVWIPLLGENRNTQFDRIYDLVKPDEVVPVLPSPSRKPRRADDLVLEYRELLFDQLRVDPRDFLYASEQNPFEVYRQIRKAVLHYREVLGLLGGCKFALSALSSKLMSLGALLVAYELKRAGVGVAHIECQGYSIDSRDMDPVLVGLWLSGECYAW
jgi:hypothetical protein